MGSGSSNTTTTKAEPWKSARPSLEQILGYGQELYNQGGFSPDPYQGQRVSPQSGGTTGAYNSIVGRGPQSPSIWRTQAQLGQMIDGNPGYASMSQNNPMLMAMAGGDPRLAGMARGDPRLAAMTSGEDIYRDLGQVKENALGSAIPAAMSMFTGNGMTDSSAAMDTVGRAATEAVAPIDYNAWQTAQDRALAATGQDSATRLQAMGQDSATRLQAQGQNDQARLSALDSQGRQQLGAAAMMPGMQQASYLPAQMMAQAGAGRDAYNQQGIQALMQKWYESQGQDMNNLQGYNQLVNQIAGQGGTTINSGGGPSGAQQIGGAALGGLGTYGALAGMGMGGPLGIAGGGLAALMGLL